MANRTLKMVLRIAVVVLLLAIVAVNFSSCSCPHFITKTEGELEATCTVDGYTGDVVCRICGEIVEEGDVIPAEHTPELQGTIEPTCTEDGFTGNEVCSVCGEVLSEGTTVPALRHKVTVSDERPATCTEAGNSGVHTCERCGEVISAGWAIAPTGHTPELCNVKAATCTEEGYTGDEVCTTCGEIISEGEVLPVIEHNGVLKDAKAATCSEEGYSGDMVCSMCGEVLSEGEVLPVIEHNGVLKNVKAATCTEGGYSGDTVCSMCGEVLSEGNATAATGHVHTEVRNAVEATTSAVGYTGDVYCADCGAFISKGSEIPKVVESTTGVVSMEQEIFRLLNEQRAANGLPALAWNDTLYLGTFQRAKEYCEYVNGRSSYGAHDRLDGRACYTIYDDLGITLNYYQIGENLAGNYTAEGFVTAWMNSPGHRANILDPDYTSMAISVYKGLYGTGSNAYTMYFAANMFLG